MAPTHLDALATAQALPYQALATAVHALLSDACVQVPARLVQALAGGGSLFVMPAMDDAVAITKLITYTPANAGSGRPTIQGDMLIFDVATGERRLILDGPTVTARRTAAVSLLAAQLLAPNTSGPLLIVGAGVQGRAHLEAFAQGFPIGEVRIASRGAAGAQALAAHARSLGLAASVVDDANAALADCPLVVTCTPASGVVLTRAPRDDAFIAAVVAFTPTMVELSPALCRHVAAKGSIWLDAADARHEAGDLLQAGLPVDRYRTLGEWVRGEASPRSAPQGPRGPVLFKSCGWAGWDLAAARAATLWAA